MSATIGTLSREVREFPEMLSTVTDPDLEVFQVTTDPEAASGRGGFFSPDSRYFFFKRHRPGSMRGRVTYALCDLQDGRALRTLSTEEKVGGAVVSRDSRVFYYFVDESHLDTPRVRLQRVCLETFRAETLAVFDRAVPGIGRAPRAGGAPVRGITGQASLRSDCRPICTGFNFVGADGKDHFAPVCVDLETLAVHGFDWEPYSWRVGGTYFRGTDPAHRTHLLMGRCNRSQHWDAQGKYSEVWYSEVHRSALHIVSEEGEIIGTVPIGGEGEGVDHPYWRGGCYEVVTHSSDTNSAPFWRGAILCGEPIACAEADRLRGKEIPGARRFDLTRRIRRPDVCHMSWHVSGLYGAFDTEGWYGRGTQNPHGAVAYLYLGAIAHPPGEEPVLVPKYLLHPRSSWNSAFTENCQELSPDLKTVFFNSDFLSDFGKPQLFCVRGFTFPEA